MTVDYFRGRRDRRRARAELDDDSFDDDSFDDDSFDDDVFDGAFDGGAFDAGAFDREFAYALLAASISGSDQRRSSSRVGAE